MIYPIFREILYPNENYSFQILDRNLASFTKPTEPYVIISITHPSDYQAKLAKSPNRKDVLRLEFDDVNDGNNKITKEHGSQIMRFIKDNMDVFLIVIHCEAGVSRSAGVGAALSKALNGCDDLFYKYYCPNSLVAQTVLEAFFND